METNETSEDGNGGPSSVPAGCGIIERDLLKALRTFKKGDFSVRMALDQTGIAGEITETFNDVVELIPEGEKLTMEKRAKEVAESIKQRMKTVNSSECLDVGSIQGTP